MKKRNVIAIGVAALAGLALLVETSGSTTASRASFGTARLTKRGFCERRVGLSDGP